MFSLRVEPAGIEYWASRYDITAMEKRVENEIVPRARQRGFLDKADFVDLCVWNSRRATVLYRSNSEDFVREVTRVSFATRNERVRLKVLTLLNGVSLPTASVLLHFTAPDPYPIIDRRSLWTVQAEPPRGVDFDFWWSYVQFTRKLAKHQKVTMRMLDRALWQYAVENQA